MVTLMILSHSPKIAEGIKDLALEMAEGAEIVAVGGTNDGRLGADFDATLTAMQAAAEKGEVLVLADLGSTRMTAQMAMETLEEELQGKVHLNDAALVEGSIIAAISIAAGLDAEPVIEQLKSFQLHKD